MLWGNTTELWDHGSATPDASPSEEDAALSQEDSSRTKGRFECKKRGFLASPSPSPPPPPPSLALFYWSFLEALVFPQLIPTWIRDDKQPVNGGLNQEMELPLRADRGGRPRLITPLFRLWARPPRGGAAAFSYSSLIELIEPG